jgi:hypothetical protein
MKSLLTTLAATVLLSAYASAGDPCLTGCDDGQPPCGDAYECVFCCRPVVKKEPIEKECFEVKCEYICVPPVNFSGLCCLFGRGCNHAADAAACNEGCTASSWTPAALFPWQNGGESAKCGGCNRIRKVHKLSKTEYECGERCVVNWEIDCVCRRVSCKPAGACDAPCLPATCAPVAP